MKRPFLLPLVIGAPLGDFLGFYLEGLGVTHGYGFLIAAASMLMLPFVVSLLLAVFCVESTWHRFFVFSATLILQFVLIFTFVPPGARVEMMGIVRRVKRKVYVEAIPACASQLLQKYQNGTLATNSPPSRVYPPVAHAIVMVSESELPKALRGKFRCVAIIKNAENPDVVFEIEPQIGIICSKNQFEENFFHYKIMDGIYAYHYQRP